MAKKLPTQRTLEWLREHGFHACVVERFNHHTKTRNDAFGFGDILCFPIMVHPEMVVTLVQTTSTTNMASRIQKIHDLPLAQEWLAHPRRHALVIGWAKRGKVGKRKLWVPRIVRVTAGGNVTLVDVLTP